MSAAAAPEPTLSRSTVFLQRVRSSLLGCRQRPPTTAPRSICSQRVVLLYRDSLDGAMFVDNDNRTTCQLLGNPAVRQFLLSSLRDRPQAGEGPALPRPGAARSRCFGGPYLWFNFISRAVAHSVACLIVDYNRHAIPLEELSLADRCRAPPLRALAGDAHRDTNAMPETCPATTDERTYLTTAFTALHFLDFDPERDREVEARFGAEMLARLRRDRSLLIRRVFGTYPWNLQPREQRILNLYALYERWLAGGRALLLPLFLLVGGIRRAWHWAGWICRAVNEIRRPELRVDRTGEIEADFATAVRKIERMRGPVVYASLRLRAAMDPEYLGVRVPGSATTGLEGADVQTDLRFLDAEPWIAERDRAGPPRAEADMRRLSRLIDEGLLTRAAGLLDLPPDGHQHAGSSCGPRPSPTWPTFAACGGCSPSREIIDGGLRACSAGAAAAEVRRGSVGLQTRLQPLLPRASDRQPRDPLRLLVGRAAEPLGRGRRAAHLAIATAPPAARMGETILAEILRHPGRITEQLVTMRAIQTLAILDVLNYRQHVYELGQYAAAGDAQEALLKWQTLGKPDRAD